MVRLSLLLFLTILVAASGCASEKPIQASHDEVETHRVTPFQPLRDGAISNDPLALMASLPLQLTVDSHGRVTSAKLRDEVDPRLLRYWMPAAAMARRWTFRPFIRDGRRVAATFAEDIPIYPPERPVARQIPFPSIDGSFEISMFRTPCFGTCPSYRVTIRSDGSVHYSGFEFVNAKGDRTRNVDPAAVRRLAEKARASNFFSLDDRYAYLVTDNPTTELVITVQGRSKRVSDYVGLAAGMPYAVKELEEEVDKLAKTEEWVGHSN